MILSNLINLIASSNPILVSDFKKEEKNEKNEKRNKKKKSIAEMPKPWDCPAEKNNNYHNYNNNKKKKKKKIHDNLGNQLQAFF